MDRERFYNLLKTKGAGVVLQFSEKWCPHCVQIQPCADRELAARRLEVYKMGIDNEVYSHLKAKKQVKGIPAMLAYTKDNQTPYADCSVSGSDEADLAVFFKWVDKNFT
jgi:hypothetical protein